MTRAELKSMAKEQMNGKLGMLIAIILLIGVITFAVSAIPVLGAIIAFIITPAFSLAVSMIYLKVARKEDIEISDAFKRLQRVADIAFWNTHTSQILYPYE